MRREQKERGQIGPTVGVLIAFALVACSSIVSAQRRAIRASRFQPIAALEVQMGLRTEAEGIGVGRYAVIRERSSGWLASYDACRQRWRRFEGANALGSGADLVALGDHQAAIIGAGVYLADLRRGTNRSFPRAPSAGGYRVPLDNSIVQLARARFDAAHGWTEVVASQEVSSLAIGRERAFGSSARHLMVWGGRAGRGYVQGGALFDDARSQWTIIPSAGGPPASSQAVVVWTGDRFFVFGGANASGALNEGGLYEPTGTWTPLRTSAPQFGGVLGAKKVGRRILVWNQTLVGAYDLDSGEWDEAQVPSLARAIKSSRSSRHLVFATHEQVHILNTTTLRWREVEIPEAMRRRARVDVVTDTHLVMWGGGRGQSHGVASSGPPNNGLPHVTVTPQFDGVALPLSACR